jgi:hypothetical protein
MLGDKTVREIGIERGGKERKSEKGNCNTNKHLK